MVRPLCQIFIEYNRHALERNDEKQVRMSKGGKTDVVVDKPSVKPQNGQCTFTDTAGIARPTLSPISNSLNPDVYRQPKEYPSKRYRLAALAKYKEKRERRKFKMAVQRQSRKRLVEQRPCGEASKYAEANEGAEDTKTTIAIEAAEALEDSLQRKSGGSCPVCLHFSCVCARPLISKKLLISSLMFDGSDNSLDRCAVICDENDIICDSSPGICHQAYKKNNTPFGNVNRPIDDIIAPPVTTPSPWEVSFLYDFDGIGSGYKGGNSSSESYLLNGTSTSLLPHTTGRHLNMTCPVDSMSLIANGSGHYQKLVELECLSIKLDNHMDNFDSFQMDFVCGEETGSSSFSSVAGIHTDLMNKVSNASLEASVGEKLKTKKSSSPCLKNSGDNHTSIQETSKGDMKKSLVHASKQVKKKGQENTTSFLTLQVFEADGYLEDYKGKGKAGTTTIKPGRGQTLKRKLHSATMHDRDLEHEREYEQKCDQTVATPSIGNVQRNNFVNSNSTREEEGTGDANIIHEVDLEANAINNIVEADAVNNIVENRRHNARMNHRPRLTTFSVQNLATQVKTFLDTKSLQKNMMGHKIQDISDNYARLLDANETDGMLAEGGDRRMASDRRFLDAIEAAAALNYVTNKISTSNVCTMKSSFNINWKVLYADTDPFRTYLKRDGVRRVVDYFEDKLHSMQTAIKEKKSIYNALYLRCVQI